MCELTYGFAIKGLSGVEGGKTLVLTTRNARTGCTLSGIEFGSAEEVRTFLEAMRGLASVVFPDPQPQGGEPPARDSLWQYERRQESEE